MQEFYIGLLKIHGPDVANFWLTPPINGMESPEYRITSYDNPGEDGSKVSSALYGGRIVTLTGIIKGSNPANFRDNRLLLSNACALQRDGDGAPVLTKIMVTMLTGNVFYFYAQVDKPIFNWDNINWSKFFINLIVPDPQIYGETTVTSDSITLPVATGVTFPVTFPVTFGGLVGGSDTLNNNGNLFTWPIITLNAQLTNPVIRNVTADKLLQLNYTLLGGDVITIDMANKTIMLNGTSNLLNAKTSDSEWWAIEPGDNVITLSSGNTADNGSAQIVFNPAYTGL